MKLASFPPGGQGDKLKEYEVEDFWLLLQETWCWAVVQAATLTCTAEAGRLAKQLLKKMLKCHSFLTRILSKLE